MSRYLALFLFVILLLTGGCAHKGESELSKALSGIVKEKKLSRSKMETILKEYEKLRDDDKNKAREYVEHVLGAIEMGGDSSHIDVVRRQVLKTRTGKAKV